MDGSRNEITEIRCLQAAGIELNESQRSALREYKRRYQTRQVCVYLRGKREVEWKAMAAASGNSFSQWLQDRVAESLLGPGPREEELANENQQLREELHALRGVNGKLGIENERLGTRMQSLEADLLDSMERVLGMMDVPQ